MFAFHLSVSLLSMNLLSISHPHIHTLYSLHSIAIV